jgi:hypothetical protein
MRRRKPLSVLAVGLAVVVVVGAFALWPGQSKITRESFDRIQKGMSRAEVEAILGGPPGDYRTVCTVWTVDDDTEPFTVCSIDSQALNAAVWGYERDQGEPVSSGEPVTGTWYGNNGSVQIHFSPDVVEDKHFLPTVEREQTPVGNLFWRAKRQWRKWFPK